MSNWIIIYEPLHEIITFSKKKFYIKSNNLDKTFEFMQNNKFLKVKNNLINVSSIDTIEPASNDLSQLEWRLGIIQKDKAELIRNKVIERKDTHKKNIPNWILENIINSFN